MAIDLESNNSELVRAAWTAMDQTYGTVASGFSLQPIDNGGQGRIQPWETPAGFKVVTQVAEATGSGKIVFYKNEQTDTVMVVAMGTNGNQDSQGWWSNAKDFGFSQWRKAMKMKSGMKLFLGRTGTRALCGLYLALLGLGVSLPAHAYKMSDVVPERAYPIQEIGILGGFEWLDANRLIAVQYQAGRGAELAIYDLAQQQWKSVLPVSGFYSSNLACVSLDQRVIQVNVLLTRDSFKSELRKLSFEPKDGVALSGLEIGTPDERGCGNGRLGSANRPEGSWYGAIPADRAIYPLGRKEDGYLDFGKWPVPQSYISGYWVKANNEKVDAKMTWDELRIMRERYSKFMPYLNGYQLNQRCETDQYPTRPPLFFFLRSGAAEIETVPMPIDAMRKIGFCRQAIALKDGYFIDASGWPAPSNGAMFGLFHILNDKPYLIEGTANRYLVDATRVSPDGCKVAYQVAGSNYPMRRKPDTRIVNFCAKP